MSEDAVARKYSRVGDSYWSPVTVSNGELLQLNTLDPKLVKKGGVVNNAPESLLHFTKDEVKTYELDLTKILWNASMKADWPRWNLFEVVPKGSYVLFFILGSTTKLKSNEVKVSVE